MGLDFLIILFLLIGLLLAVFVGRRQVAVSFCWLADKLALVVEERFWHDFLHHNVLIEPFKAMAAFLANPIDRGLVDGVANGLAWLVQRESGELRQVQTGYVRHYALSILLGVVVIVTWFILRSL